MNDFLALFLFAVLPCAIGIAAILVAEFIAAPTRRKKPRS